MFPATGGRIAGAILAAALGLGMAASALAEPKMVTEINGRKLNLYSEAGKLVDSMSPKDVPLPLDILGVSANGKFLIEIPGKGEVWILKAQTVTNESPPEIAVSCDNITESFGSSRGLAVCD